MISFVSSVVWIIVYTKWFSVLLAPFQKFLDTPLLYMCISYTCHEIILHMLTGDIDCIRGLVVLLTMFRFSIYWIGSRNIISFTKSSEISLKCSTTIDSLHYRLKIWPNLAYCSQILCLYFNLVHFSTSPVHRKLILHVFWNFCVSVMMSSKVGSGTHKIMRDKIQVKKGHGSKHVLKSLACTFNIKWHITWIFLSEKRFYMHTFDIPVQDRLWWNDLRFELCHSMLTLLYQPHKSG